MEQKGTEKMKNCSFVIKTISNTHIFTVYGHNNINNDTYALQYTEFKKKEKCFWFHKEKSNTAIDEQIQILIHLIFA